MFSYKYTHVYFSERYRCFSKTVCYGEVLGKIFNNTVSWSFRVISLRVGGSRMQALIPRIIHVQSNDNELKQTGNGNNPVLRRGDHWKATCSQNARISLLNDNDNHKLLAEGSL